MTEMARPYKREEDKVIIDNIDSILDSRELRLEIQETLKHFTEAGKSLEVQMARAEKMLVQLNRRLEMTIQYIKTQNKINEQALRIALQQNKLTFGFAKQNKQGRYSYYFIPHLTAQALGEEEKK